LTAPQSPDSVSDMDDVRYPTRRFKRAEYDKLTEIGLWAPGERLELLDGLLVVREPQGTPHATAIRLAVEALRRAFGEGWQVDAQLPVALDDDSEPEPDVSVVLGGARDYRGEHPKRPSLVVEVADTSLMLDRRFKLALYARARIQDFWIVNLVDALVEVYRDPIAAGADERSWRYSSVRLARAGETVTPLAAPDARIAVVDLLP
jgi:Uma2 family endonuclease